MLGAQYFMSVTVSSLKPFYRFFNELCEPSLERFVARRFPAARSSIGGEISRVKQSASTKARLSIATASARDVGGGIFRFMGITPPGRSVPAHEAMQRTRRCREFCFGARSGCSARAVGERVSAANSASHTASMRSSAALRELFKWKFGTRFVDRSAAP